jgi:hypothetical protein
MAGEFMTLPSSLASTYRDGSCIAKEFVTPMSNLRE